MRARVLTDECRRAAADAGGQVRHRRRRVAEARATVADMLQQTPHAHLLQRRANF